MQLKTDAIKKFLELKTIPELASLYNANMECQVNVAQDGGERVEGSFRGKSFHAWTDGVNQWKSFRIPFNAHKDPEYTDSILKFSLVEHAEAIGMTGWDWGNRVSRWVAFDFDSIVGHKEGLSAEELETIKQSVSEIPWVTIRKSTGGRGLHLYVFFENESLFATANHSEHAALGRAILSQMCALASYDFSTKVDICGGNMWVWHRKMAGTDGLTLIKKGITLAEPPNNWREHINVVKNRSRKVIAKGLPDTIEDLSAQNTKVPLDEEHRKLINYLATNSQGYSYWWDQDHYMLVTHTKILQIASEELKLKGKFLTISEGNNPQTPNCFLFPLKRGAWAVRRYSLGTKEHESWEQDSAGWTRTYLNKELDFRSAARLFKGIEDSDGSFSFTSTENIIKVLKSLGVDIEIEQQYLNRNGSLKVNKDGKLVFTMRRETTDRGSPDGFLEKKSTAYQRVLAYNRNNYFEQDTINLDDTIRHIVTHKNQDCGWVVRVESDWNFEPRENIKLSLKSQGMKTTEIDVNLGACINKPWILVNEPFETEYPGGRKWNHKSAQLKYLPYEDTEKELYYPTWQSILDHCGRNLDSAVKKNNYCKQNGILTGSDYLFLWSASLYQLPTEPLPYLFFYGNQNTGKSIFHEAHELLLQSGYARAELALTNNSGFNGELEGTVLAVVEEIDLSTNKGAYNKIKDWVTAKFINIRRMHQNAYLSPNTTHWIQVANDHNFCPIFPGDTRIVMIHVDNLAREIPKRELLGRLEREAQDFITALLRAEIPTPVDRLSIPVIETADKKALQVANRDELQTFIAEYVIPANGYVISFEDFYQRFITKLEPTDAHKWTKLRITRSVPPIYPKGRHHTVDNNGYAFGNMFWKEQENNIDKSKKRLIVVNEQLVYEEA